MNKSELARRYGCCWRTIDRRLNPDILDIIIEDEDEIIANSLFEKGISQGVSQGIEQRNIEIAKKMLEEESNIDFQSNWIIKACDKRY